VRNYGWPVLDLAGTRRRIVPFWVRARYSVAISCHIFGVFATRMLRCTQNEQRCTENDVFQPNPNRHPASTPDPGRPGRSEARALGPSGAQRLRHP
jgi:hypothetical protein